MVEFVNDKVPTPPRESSVRGPATAHDDRCCVVTGATGTLGKATARELARAGATVVLVCRSRDRGQAALAEVRGSGGTSRADLALGDLSSLSSVRALAAAIARSHPKVHVLVNAAAVFVRRRVVTPDGLELMFATNHLGPFLLTNLLSPALTAAGSSRVVNVTAPSTTKLDFEDLQGERTFRPLHAFGASKMANLLFTFEAARRWQGTGVTHNAFHPGLLRSELMRDAPAFARFLLRIAGRPPETAARALVHLATDPGLAATSGAFYKRTERIEPDPYAREAAVQSRLWKLSADLSALE